MRRRRLLIASLAAVTGCTTTGYRATGPRTPPPAPATDTDSTTSVDPVESRAQAIVRPLNEVYRFVRGPLGSFEVDEVTADELSTAEASLDRAREALTLFSQNVADPPAQYRSFPELVTAHESLLDGLVGAVEFQSSLSSLDGDVEPTAPLSDRLVSARSAVTTLGDAVDALGELARTGLTVPPAMFLTVNRLRAFATTLEVQSMAAGRLVDATEQTREGAADWRVAVEAFERDAFDETRVAVDDARIHYRAATDVIEGVVDAEGSFDELTEHRSCVAEAGVEATALGFDAVDAATMGDVARAEHLLERAETTRNRCTN